MSSRKSGIQILTEEEANVAKFRGLVGNFKETIKNIEEAIDYLNREIKRLSRQITINTKTNGLSLENRNIELSAQISENEGLLINKRLLLTDKQQLLAKTEEALYTHHLIIQVAQNISEFENTYRPLITFVTNNHYWVPLLKSVSDRQWWSSSPPADDNEIQAYRKRVIKLLLPFIQSGVVDTRTEHSHNPYNSPYCNGLQGAKNAMDEILSTISEILNYLDNNKHILSTLHINTRRNKSNDDFFHILVEEVSSAQSINYNLDNITPERFSDCTDAKWDTRRTFDELGYCTFTHSYDDRIRDSFRPLIRILAIIKKIRIISDELNIHYRRRDRKELLTLTHIIAITAAPTTAITAAPIQQLFKCASGRNKRYWANHIASFLSESSQAPRL